MRLDFGHVMALAAVATLALLCAVAWLGGRGDLARWFDWTDEQDQRAADLLKTVGGTAIILEVVLVVGYEAGLGIIYLTQRGIW